MGKTALHVEHMFLCWSHVSDDSNPQRAERAAPAPQIARGARRYVIVRLLAERNPRGGRTPNDRGAARAAAAAQLGLTAHGAGRRGPRRARSRVIVLDASVLLELVLRTPAAAAVER